MKGIFPERRMIRSKIETYIGFAIKAGRYKCGANAAATLKRAELLVLCHTAAKNSVEECVKLAKRFRCKIVLSRAKTVEELTNKEHCKILAITDGSLAKAILERLDDEFTEFKWEAE